jgi:hypothetical protein
MKRPLHSSLITGTLLSLAAAFLMAGCPKGADLEDPERFRTVDGFCDAKPVFENSCGLGSTCHEPDDEDPSEQILGYIDLITDTPENPLVARLIDQPANYDTVDLNKDQCPVSNPELLVDSQNPNESLLIKKIEDRQDCGRKMPYTTVRGYNDSSVACIKDWVFGIIAQNAGGAGGAGEPTGQGGNGGAQ